MNRRVAMLMFAGVVLGGAAGFRVLRAQGQQAQFPLAAPAGKDSGAITAAPPGAVNQAGRGGTNASGAT
jgi:hypothetical protein